MRVRLGDILSGLFKQADFDPYLVAIWTGQHRWWWRTPKNEGRVWDLKDAWLFTFEEAMGAVADTPPEAEIIFMRLDASALYLTSSGQRQKMIRHWEAQAFGSDLAERRRRDFEEQVEFGQAVGLTQDEALAIVRFVFARMPGEPGIELGQAQVTRLVLAEMLGLSLACNENAELGKVLSRPLDYWRMRNQVKREAGL